ncbi:hypothetical protein JOQ06_020192, partial [Pogonophryne albipinna]
MDLKAQIMVGKCSSHVGRLFVTGSSLMEAIVLLLQSGWWCNLPPASHWCSGEIVLVKRSVAERSLGLKGSCALRPGPQTGATGQGQRPCEAGPGVTLFVRLKDSKK